MENTAEGGSPQLPLSARRPEIRHTFPAKAGGMNTACFRLSGARMEKNSLFLSINPERCIGCGLCEKACRRFIFEKDPATGIMNIRKDKIELCMHCGQCLSVCPSFAVSLDGLTGEILPEAAPCPPAGLLADLLRCRRSTGCFFSRRPERKLLLEALADTASAPSASNLRTLCWKIIDDPEKLERLRKELLPYYEQGGTKRLRSHYDNAMEGRDSLLRGAPCLIVAMAPAGAPWGPTDCAIAVTQLELTLLTRGIGACWAGSVIQIARDHCLKELCIPEGYAAFGALMAGYPAIRYVRLPPRELSPVLFNDDNNL